MPASHQLYQLYPSLSPTLRWPWLTCRTYGMQFILQCKPSLAHREQPLELRCSLSSEPSSSAFGTHLDHFTNISLSKEQMRRGLHCYTERRSTHGRNKLVGKYGTVWHQERGGERVSGLACKRGKPSRVKMLLHAVLHSSYFVIY